MHVCTYINQVRAFNTFFLCSIVCWHIVTMTKRIANNKYSWNKEVSAFNWVYLSVVVVASLENENQKRTKISIEIDPRNAKY